MLKWCLVAAAVVVALAIAAAAALPWLLDTPAVRAYVVQAAAHALGRPVKYGSLSVSAFPLPAVRLRGLEVADDPAFGSAPFLTVDEGRVGIRLRPLLSGRVEIADLTLDEPRIAIVEDAAGRLNVASLGAAAGPPPAPPRGGGARRAGAGTAVVFSAIKVVDGSVRYRKLGAGPGAVSFTLGKINLTVTQAGPTAPVEARGDAVVEPGSVRVTVKSASLRPESGRMLGEMPLSATVGVEAADVGPVGAVFLPSPSLAGPATGQFEVSGTASKATVSGVLSFGRLTVSEQRPECGAPARRQLVVEAVRVPVAATRGRVESAPVTATVARGSVSLRAVVSLGSPTAAALKEISVKGVELTPLLVDFLCQPYAVTGPLELTGEAALSLPEVWRSLGGAGRLRVGAGKVVGREIVNLLRDVIGLGTAVAALARPGRPPASSPLDFDSITATYTISGGVVRTEDLLYQARDVKVRAAGTYGLADQRVAMEVTLSQGANQVKGLVSGAPGSLRVVPTGVRLDNKGDIKKFLDRLFR